MGRASGQVGSKSRLDMRELPRDTAVDFIRRYHYSKVMPRINRHYLGFFVEGRLCGVIVLGWGNQPL